MIELMAEINGLFVKAIEREKMSNIRHPLDCDCLKCEDDWDEARRDEQDMFKRDE